MINHTHRHPFNRCIATFLAITFLWQGVAFSAIDSDIPATQTLQVLRLFNDPSLQQRFVPLVQRYLETGLLEENPGRPILPLDMLHVMDRLRTLEPWLDRFGHEMGYEECRIDRDGLGTEVTLTFSAASRAIGIRYYNPKVHGPRPDADRTVPLSGFVAKDIMVEGEVPPAGPDASGAADTPDEESPAPGTGVEGASTFRRLVRRVVDLLLPDGPGPLITAAISIAFMLIMDHFWPGSAPAAAPLMMLGTNGKKAGRRNNPLLNDIATAVREYMRQLPGSTNRNDHLSRSTFDENNRLLTSNLMTALGDSAMALEAGADAILRTIETTMQEEWRKLAKKLNVTEDIRSSFAVHLAGRLESIADRFPPDDPVSEMLRDAGISIMVAELKKGNVAPALEDELFKRVVTFYREKNRDHDALAELFSLWLIRLGQRANGVQMAGPALNDYGVLLQGRGERKAARHVYEAILRLEDPDLQARTAAVRNLMSQFCDVEVFREEGLADDAVPLLRREIEQVSEVTRDAKLTPQEEAIIAACLQQLRIPLAQLLTFTETLAACEEAIELVEDQVDSRSEAVRVSALEQQAVLSKRAGEERAASLFADLARRADEWLPREGEEHEESEIEAHRAYLRLHLRFREGEGAPLIAEYASFLDDPRAAEITRLYALYDYIDLLILNGRRGGLAAPLAEFFGIIDALENEEGKNAEQLIASMVWYSDRAHLRRLAAVLEGTILTNAGREGIDPGVLSRMTQLLIGYSHIGVQKAADRLWKDFYRDPPSASDLPGLEAVLTRLGSFDGTVTRTFLRECIRVSDGDLREGLERYLRTGAIMGEEEVERMIPRYLDFAAIASLYGTVESASYVRDLQYDILESHYIRNGDDPLKVVELALRLEEEAQKKLGDRYATYTFALQTAVDIIAWHVRAVPAGSAEQFELHERLDAFLKQLVDLDKKRIAPLFEKVTPAARAARGRRDTDIERPFYAQVGGFTQLVHNEKAELYFMDRLLSSYRTLSPAQRTRYLADYPKTVTAILGRAFALDRLGRRREADEAHDEWALAVTALTGLIAEGGLLSGCDTERSSIREAFKAIGLSDLGGTISVGRATPAARAATAAFLRMCVEAMRRDFDPIICTSAALWAYGLAEDDIFRDAFSVYEERAAAAGEAGGDAANMIADPLLYLQAGFIRSQAGNGDGAEEMFERAEAVMESEEAETLLDELELFSVRVQLALERGDPESAIMILEDAPEPPAEAVVKADGYVFAHAMFAATAYRRLGDDVHAREAVRDLFGYLERRQRESEFARRRLAGFARLSFPGSIRTANRAVVSEAEDLLLAALRDPDGYGVSAETLPLLIGIIAGVFDGENADALLDHFCAIVDGDVAFAEERDRALAEILCAARPDACILLRRLIESIPAPNKQVKRVLEKMLRSLPRPADHVADAAVYLRGAGWFLSRGDIDAAASLLEEGMAALPSGADELKRMYDDLRQTRAAYRGFFGCYHSDDYAGARENAGIVRDRNARLGLTLEAHLGSITAFERAGSLLGQGDLARAIDEVRGARQDDKARETMKKLRSLHSLIANVEERIGAGAYAEAERVLESARVFPLTVCGETIDGRDHPLVQDLRRRIADYTAEVRDRLAAIAAAEDILTMHAEARELLKYPEARKETFHAILARAVARYGEGKHRFAFDAARLIYEFKDYDVPQDVFRKAQAALSQAAAQLWLPELVDDYYIILTMLKAAAERERQDRMLMHLAHGQPLDFAFARYEVKNDGLVLSGFADVGDMTPFVLHGDTFMLVRSVPGSEDEEEFVEFLKPQQVTPDTVTLTIPRTHRGYDAMTEMLTGFLNSEGTYRIRRVTDLSWENQRMMLETLIEALRQSLRPSLDTGAEHLPLATTGTPVIDRVLGIRLDLPTERQSAAITAEERLIISHLPAGMLDEVDSDGQRSAGLAGANTAIPFTLCQGPAGTGKTTVILWLIRAILNHDAGASIRVLSQTNPAVDNIAIRLLQEAEGRSRKSVQRELYFARVGNREGSVAPEVIDIWLDKKERLRLMGQGRRSNIMLCTTNGGCLDRDVRNSPNARRGKYMVFDESSRATVPESLWPLFWFGDIEKVIFVGDQDQLPAYGVSDEDIEFAVRILTPRADGRLSPREPHITPPTGSPLRDLGERPLADVFHRRRVSAFKTSLLERAIRMFEGDMFAVTKPDFHFLKIQRRSGRDIVDLDNYFYEGRLVPGRDIDGEVIEDDYEGRYRDERETADGKKAVLNRGEAARAVTWVSYLMNEKGLAADDIAVITPYNGQVDLIKKTLMTLATVNAHLRAVAGAADDAAPPADLEELLLSDAVRWRLEDLYGRDRVEETIRPLRLFLEAPSAESAAAALATLALGEAFPTPSDVEDEIISVVTVDSAIGSQWKAVILSWVRSNYRPPRRGRTGPAAYTGRVGFLADDIYDDEGDNEGRKRRNVAVSRAEDILINVWDRRTFTQCNSPEIRRWAEYSVNVFERARARREAAAVAAPENAFIGDYLVVEPVEYHTYSNTFTGILEDRKTGKRLDLADARLRERAPPADIRAKLDRLAETFDDPLVAELTDRFNETFYGAVVVFEHPDDPTLSFGYPGVIGISRPLIDTDFGILHEAFHAVLHGDDALQAKLEKHLGRVAPEKLRIMLEKADEDTRAHYLLRAFQWHLAEELDRKLTLRIKELAALRETVPAPLTADDIITNAAKTVPRLAHILTKWAAGTPGEHVLMLDLPPVQNARVLALLNEHVIEPLKRLDGNESGIGRFLENLSVVGADKRGILRDRIDRGTLAPENVVILTAGTTEGEAFRERFTGFERSLLTALDTAALDAAEGLDWEAVYYPYLEAAFFSVLRRVTDDERVLYEWYRRIPNVSARSTEEFHDLLFEKDGTPKRHITLDLVLPVSDILTYDDQLRIHEAIEEFLVRA